MKKTAVDYLFEKLWGIHKDKFTWQMILKEAKQKEKEQIINAAADHCYPTEEEALMYAEQYYNETYENK